MKRLFGISISIVIIGVIYFIYTTIRHQVIGTELKITFVNAQRHTPNDLACEGLLNDWEWGILSDAGQQKNWEKDGYVIPPVDFNKNYLIMSRFKITKLYQKPGCDECTGVPDGEAIFDKDKSDKNFYYFYLMPKIMLSQGVG